MADSVDELFPEPQMTDDQSDASQATQHVDPQPGENLQDLDKSDLTGAADAGTEGQVATDAATAPQQVETKEEEPRVIPLATALNWRDEAREYKRRIVDLEAQQKQRPEQSSPDPFDDPAGFAAYQEQRVEQRLTQERFAMSDTIARQQHGAETVEAAVQWAQERAQADPMFAGSYMRQPHPIDWIVQQHKRDADLSDYQKDPVAFARRILEANGQLSAPVAAPVAAAPTPAPAPARVPRSLASQGTAPSDVRQTASGPLAGVDALFS